MALKQIILGDKLRKARERLEQAQHKAEEARSQRTELETREAELTAAIEETETDEQRSEVEEMVNSFEAEKEGQVVPCDDLPKSFIVTAEYGMDRVYLTSLNSATLERRMK